MEHGKLYLMLNQFSTKKVFILLSLLFLVFFFSPIKPYSFREKKTVYCLVCVYRMRNQTPDLIGANKYSFHLFSSSLIRIRIVTPSPKIPVKKKVCEWFSIFVYFCRYQSWLSWKQWEWRVIKKWYKWLEEILNIAAFFCHPWR